MQAPSPRIRIVVDLLAGREPLSGEVLACDGRVTPFLGWLSLAAAIERARLDHHADPEPPTGTSSGGSEDG